MLTLTVVLILAAAAGCSDNEIDYPIGDGGWMVDLTVEGSYPPSVDFPVEVVLEGWVVDLTTGSPPPAGSVLVFSTSAGVFTNGLDEIEVVPADGRASAFLTAPLPGKYEVTATYPDGDASSTVVIPVGLE
jgi:hypothetical protein